ncbi:hypothetical protein glysoja_000022 [Glycine soja]|nr:hypothetical protein glysoja_000022 [Glycine soja]
MSTESITKSMIWKPIPIFLHFNPPSVQWLSYKIHIVCCNSKKQLLVLLASQISIPKLR